MSDQERLREYVGIWWQAVHDFTSLLDQVPADAWQNPTDLPGWNVHDIAAHTAHLEAVTAGADHDTVDIGEPAHVHGVMGQFTEQGVVARKDREPDELIREIRESTTRRHTWLLSNLPEDHTALADGFAAFVGWSWERLLRNRPLDVWMHEQDIRRAIDRPGGYDCEAARHTVRAFGRALPMVVGKRVAPPAGTTVRLDVPDFEQSWALTIGADGRAARALDGASPDVTITLSPEDFVVLAGGRRPVEATSPAYDGDEALGRKVLDSLGVTP